MNDPYMQGGDDLSDPISLSGVSPMRYMAKGGFVVPPQLPVVYRPEDREYLEARQAEAEAYDAQRNAYNAALEKYKTEVYNPYESQLKAFNAAAEAYNRDVYEPYKTAYQTYEAAVNAFNAGPMDSEYAGPEAPTLRPFEMQAPVAPTAFSMTAPTVPFKEEDVAARQAQAAEAARQDAESRQFAFEAINDPGQYNLAGMSQGSGIAGLSVPGYVKGGPVFAKAPGVLSAKQMLRKLGNKTKKFADGGAVTSPTLAERVAALQKTISSMPEVIPAGSSRLGNRPMEPNPSLAAARQELAKLTGTFVLPPFPTEGLPSEVYKQNRFQVINSPVNPSQSMVVGMNGMVVSFGDSRAVKQMQKTADDYNDYYFGNSQAAPGSASSPVGVLPGGANAGSVNPAPTTVTTPTPTTAKTDLTELSKPVVVSTPPASGNAAGAAGSVIAATPSVFSGARPITALPVVPGSAPALQKPISAITSSPTIVPAPGSAKSDLTEISKPGSLIPNPPSGSVVAPSKHPDGNVYGTYTSSDGKWFWDRGKWAKNEVIYISPIERPDYQPPGTKPPELIYISPIERPDYQPPGTKPPATQPPPLMGALPIKEFMPPVAPQPVVMSPTKTPVNPLAKMVLEMAVKKTKPDMMWDATGDGRISAADALQVAKGWRPKGYQEQPVTTPPSTPTPPVTTQPVVPVPTLPTIPDTPPLFRPPPPGSMPGTLPMPFNPFQINQGPTAQDLLQQSPNLSPNILGGQGNLGFMKDRLGNVIRAPGAVRGFADGGEVEDEEPILTDPVGTASQMLRELNPQTQMEYEATPKKVSMKRISKTPMESASGSAKGMKMELEEISAMKMPKDAKRRGSLSKAEFEDLAREYGLKRDAALSSARGLMSETFGKPTLEKPSLTKRGLTKRRFEEGGEVKKSDGAEDEKASAPVYGASPEEQPVVEESKASQALKELIRPVREGIKGYFGMDPESPGSEAYRMGQAVSNMPGAGAPATLGIFIGKSSKLWNKAMNEAARKMEKSGAPPEEIWQKTGNFKGPDNQWRQEISDLGATQRTQVSQGPASMVFQHPELYQNYPDMKDLFIRTDPYAVRSSYTGSGVPGAEEINLGTAGSKLENIRGLLHEMQHGIQFREGFGLGGSKITAFNDPKAFEILEMVRKRVSTPATLEEFAKGAYQTTKITPKIEDEYKNLYLKNYAASLKSGGLDRMAQEEAARIYYNRLLGETEARAVEDRRLFTPEQRLEVFPTKSYKVDGKPVAVEDLIIKRPMERAKGGPVNKHDAFIKAHA